ncbi:MAG: hypothetical protein A2133_03005 [Actinobacteria bacterium RBG_16_64_13]|nr:MAG: hypothetical protein A2133_03005 [Actinobacteria bacterium RBG_16_64_13]
MRGGVLVVSLDFELYWGMRDVVSLRRYADNLAGVQEAIPRLLSLFVDRGIHATWAAVGFLLCTDRNDLLASLPTKIPHYADETLSPYLGMHELDEIDQHDVYYFAPQLVRSILATPHQELGTHTFSHYYCLEEGPTLDDFREDLQAVVHIAERYHVRPVSLVFPRNQVSAAHLDIARDLGFVAYRGTEKSWPYRPKGGSDQSSVIRRLTRLLDAYVCLFGSQTYLPQHCEALPVNIPSSRFLRPYSRRLARLEPLRLHRISAQLTVAARENRVFHIWWHPHNFGVDLEKNLENVERIMDKYAELQAAYGMRSLNMGELAALAYR